MSGKKQASGLCDRLNDHSKRIHKRSNALLLTKVATLFTDRGLYGRAIGCFYPVFAELEAGLRQAMETDERVWQLREVMEPMWRAPAYEQDLEFYLGKGWRQQLVHNEAIQGYVDRLKQVSREQPVLLLAHTFTNHTAGLSGGRIVKKMCKQYMHLEGDEGTAIFTFPGGVELKEAFKGRLDDVGAQLSEQEVQAVLEEHIRAFEFNIAVMKAFRVSLWARLAAPFRLIPARSWVLAAAAVAIGAAIIAALLAMQPEQTR